MQGGREGGMKGGFGREIYRRQRNRGGMDGREGQDAGQRRGVRHRREGGGMQRILIREYRCVNIA
eukprot:1392408-Amorphochlora_amoeboformis.AAC.2